MAGVDEDRYLVDQLNRLSGLKNKEVMLLFYKMQLVRRFNHTFDVSMHQEMRTWDLIISTTFFVNGEKCGVVQTIRLPILASITDIQKHLPEPSDEVITEIMLLLG